MSIAIGHLLPPEPGTFLRGQLAVLRGDPGGSEHSDREFKTRN